MTRSTTRGLTVLALLTLLAACGDRLDARRFQLRHVPASTLMPLLEPYVEGETETAFHEGPTGPTIVVRARPEVLDTIAAVIERNDRPQPTVTLRFQIIEADGFTDTDPAIGEVESALRDLFRFEGYRLLAEGVVANVTPMLTFPAERDGWTDYQVSQRVRSGGREFGILTDVRAVTRAAEGASTADLAVLLYEDTGDAGPEILLQTSVRVPDGQTVVIGNAVAASSDRTIILAVRPQIGD